VSAVCLESDPGLHLTAKEREKPVVMTDPNRPDNPIVYVSQRFLDLTGFAEREVMGHNCRFLQCDATGEEVVRRMAAAIADERAFAIDIVNCARDGTPFWNRLRIRPAYNAAGELVRFIGVQNPIPETAVNPKVRDLPILW